MNAWVFRIAVVSQVYIGLFGINSVAAGAADCPNKWSEQKEIIGKGRGYQLAGDDYDKQVRSLVKDSKCGDAKCATDKEVCQPLLTETRRSCTGDNEKGWECKGKVRVGCFCLGLEEEWRGMPPPPKPAPKLSELECSNKFADLQKLTAEGDDSQHAKTRLSSKVRAYEESENKQCAKHKCAGEKKSCRLYFAHTETQCIPKENPSRSQCGLEIRAGCFCLGEDEGVSLPPP
jgi:hypothetical protein